MRFIAASIPSAGSGLAGALGWAVDGVGQLLLLVRARIAGRIRLRLAAPAAPMLAISRMNARISHSQSRP